MSRLVDFVATKRGSGPVLHSGDPADQSLPDFVLGQLTPALRRLLDAAAISGAIRDDVDAGDRLNAGLRLATPASDSDPAQARRMVARLVDGLRYRLSVPAGWRGPSEAPRRRRACCPTPLGLKFESCLSG